MYVKTDYDGCPYITAGKVYECFVDDAGCAWIFCDDGDQIAIEITDGFECHQLDIIGDWTICDKEGNEL